MDTVYGSQDDPQDILGCGTRSQCAHSTSEKMLNRLEKAYSDAGMATLIVGFLLSYTILMSEELRNENNYRNFLTYTVSSTLRRGIPIIYRMMPLSCFMDYFFDCSNDDHAMCRFFAFLGSFIAIFEIESLTQVCIERYINVFYKLKGWHVPGWHNMLFIFLSTLFALIYSLLPIVLLGRKNYDIGFDCGNCTFSTLLPEEAAYKLIIIVMLALQSLKPVVVMISSLNQARWMEFNTLETGETDTFTLSICFVVISNIILWTPLFVVHSTIIMGQIFNVNGNLFWSPCFISWAISINWYAPAVAMIGFIRCNGRVRNKLINLVCCRPIDFEEPIPPPPTVQDPEEKTAADTK